jgi:hypothetical protein
MISIPMVPFKMGQIDFMAGARYHDPSCFFLNAPGRK